MRTWLALLLCCLASAAFADKPIAPDAIPGTQRISAREAVGLILSRPELLIVDARRPEEHAKGHIENAVSLLDSELTPQQLARYAASPATPLLIYCNGERCARSGNASRKAVAWGYREVYWFRGGWQEWLAEGLPVAR